MVYFFISESLISGIESEAETKSKIIKYLPVVLQNAEELKIITKVEDYEFDRLYPAIEGVFSESTISSCSEERLEQWERALEIIPSGTVEQRKLFLLARLRGQGKLNESKIASIVDAFTGGEATTTFENSAIVVKILPPNNGEIYLFPDVERALKPLIPAHVGLTVIRFYSTWGDIKNNFTSWNDILNFDDWQSVKKYIET